MQKELATILKKRLENLPFIDVLGGLAQTITVTETTGGAPDDESVVTTITKRYPVTDDHNQDKTIFGPEFSLIPNSNRRSIFYFEDYGITLLDPFHGSQQFQSDIRLICWLNRELLTGGSTYAMVSGSIMIKVIEKLLSRNPVNIGMFTMLTVNAVRIPPIDAALFGRYSYNETERQYLRPPFEFFGIDLRCKYVVPFECNI